MALGLGCAQQCGGQDRAVCGSWLGPPEGRGARRLSAQGEGGPCLLGTWSSGSPQPEASVLSIQVWGFPGCRGGPGPWWRPAQEFQEQGPETEQEEEGRGRPVKPAQQSPIFTSTSFYREHAWGRSRPLVADSCQRPPWPRFPSLTVSNSHPCLHHSLLSHLPSTPTPRCSNPSGFQRAP